MDVFWCLKSRSLGRYRCARYASWVVFSVAGVVDKFALGIMQKIHTQPDTASYFPGNRPRSTFTSHRPGSKAPEWPGDT